MKPLVMITLKNYVSVMSGVMKMDGGFQMK